MKLRRGINPVVPPSSTGCEECLAGEGWWVQLRRCAECGHIGCCDTSPGQHAMKHADHAGHPIIASFEPCQNWFYDYQKADIVKGPLLAPPNCHPSDQPSPGPAGRVPPEWEELIHYEI